MYKWIFKKYLGRNQLTSSYRQRLSRYRELRSRASTTHKTPTEGISGTEPSNEVNEEAYIMINSQEILRLIEVWNKNKFIFLEKKERINLGSFIIITYKWTISWQYW